CELPGLFERGRCTEGFRLYQAPPGDLSAMERPNNQLHGFYRPDRELHGLEGAVPSAETRELYKRAQGDQWRPPNGAAQPGCGALLGSVSFTARVFSFEQRSLACVSAQSFTSIFPLENDWFFVMAGQKREARLRARCPGRPRFLLKCR